MRRPLHSFASLTSFIATILAVAVLGFKNVAASPQVQFTLARTFAGVDLLHGSETWAPDGRHFVMLGSEGLLLGDVDSIQAAPVLLLRGTVREVAWAPSNRAVAVIRENADQRRRGVRDLLLVDISGTSKVLGRDLEVRAPFWLDNGALFVCTDEDGAIQPVATPPTGFGSLAGVTGHATCRLLESSLAQSVHGELAPRLFQRSPSGEEMVTTLSLQPYTHAAANSEPVGQRNTRVRVLSQRPDRYLVALLPSWITSITDSTGAVLQEVSAAADSDGIVVETLSSDGTFVLGRRGIYEDSPNLADYPLEAMALDGAWRAVVSSAPPSFISTSSANNGWLLLSDRQGTVYAGYIQLNP